MPPVDDAARCASIKFTVSCIEPAITAQRSSGGFSRLRDAVLAGDARAVAEAGRALPARAWMAGGDGAALLHEAGAMPGARSTPTTPTT
eukprot:SAG25_NODE_5261_length_681_cov_1.489691_1_plen_88_part_10